MSDIYTFYGNDSYIIKNNVKRIIKSFSIDEFNVATYDMDEISLVDAVNDCNTIPFLSEKKVVVISNAWFLTGEKKKKELNHPVDKLVQYLEKPLSSTVLILTVVNEKIDTRKALVKTLKKVSTLKVCNKIEKSDLASWVRRQTKDKGIYMDKLALEEFLRRTSFNTEIAVNEMKKLLLYLGDNKEISKDIVEKIVTENIEENVFELTNAYLSGNKEKTMGIYGDLISNNEDPIKLLGIIINKMLEILHAKLIIQHGGDKSDIMNYYHCSSGRAYYIMKNAGSVSMKNIKRYLEELEELDYSIKSGKIEKKIGLELFLLKV